MNARIMQSFFLELEKIGQNASELGIPGSNPMGGQGGSGGSAPTPQSAGPAGGNPFSGSNPGPWSSGGGGGGTAGGIDPAATAAGRNQASQQAASTISPSTQLGSAKPMSASDLGI